MKATLITLGIALIISFNSLFSGEKESIEIISKTITTLHHRNSEVWEGYELTLKPLVITFGNGHIYAFNLHTKNPAWEEKQIEGEKVLYAERDDWGLSEVAMQDNFSIEGQEAFVFNIGIMQQSGGPEQLPYLVMVHELFHSYQFGHFAKDDERGEYVDQENTENLALMQIEELVLMNFLRADGEDKVEHLKDFVAINKTRRGLMNETSRQWEDVQQKMEGLADYASIRTYDGSGILPRFSGEIYLLGILRGYIKNDDITERSVKWRHYGVGATLAYALDHLNAPNWKLKIEKGNVSQVQILDKILHLDPAEIKTRTLEAKKKYGYSRIKKKVRSQIQNYQTLVAEITEDYDRLEGVHVKIQKPAKLALNGGGSTNGIYNLPGGMNVSIKDSSVTSSSDNTWRLESKATPFLFQDKSESRLLKIEHDLELVVDGKILKIDQIMDFPEGLTFNSLSWKCSTSEFESRDIQGTIRAVDGSLEIQYE